MQQQHFEHVVDLNQAKAANHTQLMEKLPR